MTGAEITQFSDAVRNAFNFNDLRVLLLVINRRIEDYITASARYPDQVVELVGSANSVGWVGQLVMEVVKQRPANQAIRNFLLQNPDWDPARARLDHPIDTLRIMGGRSFIGREKLRACLKDMNTRTGKKVLLVTSDRRKVGKTYSRELVDFLARNSQLSDVAYVDLDLDDYDPGKLARAIASDIGPPVQGMPAQGQQQAARWSQELAPWLVPAAKTAPAPQTGAMGPAERVRWIILDGFRLKVPTEPTQDFIAQIAQRVQSTECFRLVLLNYGFRLPLGVAGFAHRERVDPITEQEVRRYLEKVHSAKYGAPPSEAMLNDYVAGVYEQVRQLAQENPDEADSQLPLNVAISDAWAVIQAIP